MIEWFWIVIASFTQEEMSRLLQFTTGCSQLPPGGFAELRPKFQLVAAPTHGILPTAHTWWEYTDLIFALETIVQGFVLSNV